MVNEKETCEFLVKTFLNVDLAKRLLKNRTSEELFDRLTWEESETFRNLIMEELDSRTKGGIN